MTESSRRKALAELGLLHPNPAAVTATLFAEPNEFFLADDKVQVKYEMLRAHVVDGVSVTASAAGHGYSRAAFYLVLDAFGQAGMTGFLDERRGRRGPLKVTPEIVAVIQMAAPAMGVTDIAEKVADRFGVELHRRTIERARGR